MELLGLKWTDLDWVKQSIKVERQLVRPDGGEAQFKQPKNKFGRRTILLGSGSIDVLRNHNDRQYQARKKAGDKWVEHGLIFSTRYGTPHHPRYILRDFKILIRKVGLPIIRFHDLRHTAASLWLNHGLSIISVSRRLGHAKVSITLDIYGHMVPSMQIEDAQKIDELITPVELHQIAPDFTPLGKP